ncbi:MAG: Coq4 family protein [Rhodospirillaceae bacterium]
MSAQVAIDTRLHPLTALRAVRHMAEHPGDPGNTRQVFVILRAMRGRSGLKAFRRFAASPTGADLLRSRPSLLATLRDRAGLARLPEGSVGRGYLDFMEGERLSADGLVQATDEWEGDEALPDLRFFRARMRDAHDLTHILTGYGRDPLGEICLLTYMYAHSRNLGMLMIVAMGWLKMPKFARAAVVEAWRNGRKARWFQDLDFETLLPRPLDEVRHELGVVAPARYIALMR